MFYKLSYGIYPVQSCSVGIKKIQEVCYLSLTTLTGAGLATGELGQLNEEQAKNLMTKLSEFINPFNIQVNAIIDLDLFLEKYKEEL
jgi:hypothetical protein